MMLIEELIKEKYKKCYVTVICKNHKHADSVTGRKIDTIIATETGKVKYLPEGRKYANQKLQEPIYHEFIWNEDAVIHHKVIRATRVNKNGYSYGYYNISRYRILNFHSSFEGKGVEFRLFNSSLKSKEVRTNIILALAICSTACYQKKTKCYCVKWFDEKINCRVKDMPSLLS